MKTAVVAFGRMNPPTIGHKKLVDKLKSVAQQNRGTPFLYLSHSQDKKKNPLSYEQKLSYARKAFGSVVTKSTSKTLLQVMKELETKGFTDAFIIAGSDRVNEFQVLLDKYNGKEFNMTSVKVISAGERDPDAEGVEGMSASKLRALAQKGDMNTFMKGIPLSSVDAKKLYTDIKSIMEETYISEGVNDPGIFKAVFLAGGPGSGKSFIVQKTALESMGLKIINSDDIFERALNKAGLDATPENIFSTRGQEIRDKAKQTTSNRQELYIKGRLGLIIDGTGKDYDKIEKQKKQLEKLGYNTSMIFVNTDLQTAKERNRRRSRSLPDGVVQRMWQDVQKNMGNFQSLFKQNFTIVDNSSNKDWKKETLYAFKKMLAFTKQPIHSPEAKKWISNMKEEQEMDEAYRVIAQTHDGEIFKSGLHPNKKSATDHHWKLSKSCNYKKVQLVKEQEMDVQEISQRLASKYLNRVPKPSFRDPKYSKRSQAISSAQDIEYDSDAYYDAIKRRAKHKREMENHQKNIAGAKRRAEERKKLYGEEQETMKTSDLQAIVERVLTLQQRQKKRMQMKKNAPRIARLRKLKLQRVAQKPALIKRARKAAVLLLKKRVAGEQGMNYASLSPSQKIQIDRMVEKKLPMVDRIAKKLLPKIMKKELDRMKSLRSGGKSDN